MSTHNFYRKPGPLISKAERKAGEPLAYRVEVEVDPDPLPFEQDEDDDVLLWCWLPGICLGQELERPDSLWERFGVDVYIGEALRLHKEEGPGPWHVGLCAGALYLRKKAWPKKKRTKALARKLLASIEQQLFATQYVFTVYDENGDQVDSGCGFFSEEEALAAAKEYMV